MPHRWCNSADVRREQIESGKDITFNEVFKPLFIKRIIALSPSHVLDVGAGTGHISKELASCGLKVTAIEPSQGMYKVAKEVLSGDNVELINCTAFELANSKIFDVAFSNMVAHVTDDLIAFFCSVKDHLVRGGHFIFSIPHPCFYNEYKGFFGQEYSYMETKTKDVTFTITKDSENDIIGVPYHHRPLSKYLNDLVRSGFTIDRFHEIYPDDKIQAMYGKRWKSPRYCVFTCKKL